MASSPTASTTMEANRMPVNATGSMSCQAILNRTNVDAHISTTARRATSTARESRRSGFTGTTIPAIATRTAGTTLDVKGTRPLRVLPGEAASAHQWIASLQRDGALALLAGRRRASQALDRVGPRLVRRELPDLERTAGALRRRGAPEERRAVVLQHDLPSLPDDVRVHLELHLDAPVVRAGLQLPGARGAAGAAVLHAAAATAGRAG